MATKEIVRKYRCSDDELAQKADGLVDSMTRDTADFATRKVDATRIAEVTTLSNQFKNYPTDKELQGAVTVATEIKDATKKDLVEKLSKVRNMAETKYGKSGKFKTFGFGELSRLKDDILFKTSKRVVRVGTTLLAELATEGLTAAQLTEISTVGATLDTNIDAIEAAEENRDIKTQERIIIGNNLWDKMVTYANIGKSLFEFKDEARYNDYVLTDAPSSTTQTPPTS